MTEEAVARESIRDLVARYNGLGDRGRFADLLELFVPDAAMELRRRGHDDHRRYEGRVEIESIFTGVSDQVEGRDDSRPAVAFVRHLTATHVIDLGDDGDTATGSCYFQVLTDTGLDHWGRYADRYVRADGRWRFAERVVTTEGWAEGSAFREQR